MALLTLEWSLRRSRVGGRCESPQQDALGWITNRSRPTSGDWRHGQKYRTDRVELEGEARSRDNQKLDGQTRAMVDAMESAAREIGAQLELDVVRAYESFSWEKDHPVVQMAWAAAEKAGLEPQLVSSGGGTDAHIIISKGIPTAVLGVGLVKPHSLEEHIKIEDMVSLTHQLVALIRTAHES